MLELTVECVDADGINKLTTPYKFNGGNHKLRGLKRCFELNTE